MNERNTIKVLILFWLSAAILLITLSVWAIYAEIKPPFLHSLLIFVIGWLLIYLVLRESFAISFPKRATLQGGSL